MNPIRLAAVVFLIGLAGCEVTTFQNPPLAEIGCDARLVGNWFSVADSDSNDSQGEVELRIDKSCSLLAIEHKQGGDERHIPTTLHFGHDGGQGYAWVDFNSLFPTDKSSKPADNPDVPAGDLYVLRYSVSDKRLQLYKTDDHAIAHRIIDGKLSGDITKKGFTLLNRLTDKVTPEQLRSDVAFDPKPLQFTRDHPEPAK